MFGRNARLRAGSVLFAFSALVASCTSGTAPDRSFVAPPSLLDVTLYEALEAGDVRAALDAIAASDAKVPGQGYAHTLMLRRILKERDPLREYAGFQALEALTLLPKAPARVGYTPLKDTIDGTSSVAYARSSEATGGFGEVFLDAMVLLGRGKPQVLSSTQAPAPHQRLVLEPGIDVGVLPINRVVALGPQPELVRLLGLKQERIVPMQACVFTSNDIEMELITRQALELPVEGSVSVFAQAGTTAEVVAQLKCADGEYPALYRLKRNGGEPAFMFAFDLLASTARTRQGDPAIKNREIDGVEGARPSDLFQRDLSQAQLAMPFSDLLLEATLELIEGTRPSVRFWHNPVGKRGVFIITSDQDFADPGRMAIMMAELASWGVPATFYLTSGTYQPDGKAHLATPSAALVDLARTLDFTFGAHTWLATPARPAHEIVEEHAKALREGYKQAPHSVRFHIVTWPGYEEPAEALERAGYRYDTSYLTLHSRHIAGLGYMTGSGLPMRFFRPDGTPLKIRQLATQLDDHPHPVHDTGLRDRDTGRSLQMGYQQLVSISRSLMEAAGRFHSPIVLNNHPYQFVDDPAWLRMLVETARLESIAVLDVERYDELASALMDSQLTTVADKRFRTLVQAAQQDVIVRNHPGDVVLVDGQRVNTRTRAVYGRPETFVTLTRGKHEIVLQ